MFEVKFPAILLVGSINARIQLSLAKPNQMKSAASATKKAALGITGTVQTSVDQLAKTFTLADLIKHAHFEKKTILEACAQYPSKGKILLNFAVSHQSLPPNVEIGVGFKIWKKHWPKDTYYEVKEAKFKVRAVSDTGRRDHYRPLRIRDTIKRSLWQYSVEDSQVKLDNGVEYSSDEMKAFKFLYLPKEEKK